MGPLERKVTAACVGMLGEAFRQKVSDATIRAYEIGLDGMTAESIEQATARSIRECRWMPVPAELRAFAREHLRSTQPRRLEVAHPFRAPQLVSDAERADVRRFLADCMSTIGKLPRPEPIKRIGVNR